MKEIKESNKKVVIDLYNDGYKIKEISQLTNNSIATILKYLTIKKA